MPLVYAYTVFSIAVVEPDNFSLGAFFLLSRVVRQIGQSIPR